MAHMSYQAQVQPRGGEVLALHQTVRRLISIGHCRKREGSWGLGQLAKAFREWGLLEFKSVEKMRHLRRGKQQATNHLLPPSLSCCHYPLRSSSPSSLSTSSFLDQTFKPSVICTHIFPSYYSGGCHTLLLSKANLITCPWESSLLALSQMLPF